ncbi:MAG: type I phosphomannose isomerase catalytic subunit [Bacillota bacterium]
MLYPMIFRPVFKDYIWGGRELARFGKKLPPDGIVAESWELSSHPDGESVVANGDFEGETFTTLVKRYGSALVGNALPADKIAKFPLLVKFIDAKQSLSVQVHPNDSFAYANEGGELGKNEMWYIMAALPGAKIVYDVAPGTTRATFAKAIEEGRIRECLNFLPVKAGDFVDIPAGMLHAIGEGIVLAEVQQNSNTTYRVYDYERLDGKGNARELHIEKSLEVIDFDTASHPGIVQGTLVESDPNFTRTSLVSNEYFTVEKLNVSGVYAGHADGSRFYIYIVLSGNATLESNVGASKISLQTGTTVLIPAEIGDYTISGEVEMLKAWV